MPNAIAAPTKLVLLIEDEIALAEEVCNALRAAEWRVELATTFEDGLARARTRRASVLVVDRMLNDADGLSIVESLRREEDATPVLIISALSTVDDRVRGLKGGGDDYLVKPFSLSELVARVAALVRRGEQVHGARIKVGALEMDLLEREVWRDGERIDLQPREFKLLAYFMRRPGQLVTREMLLEDLWHYRFHPETKVVDVHISNLRRKLGDGRKFILSLRAEGFKLNADA